MVTEVGKWKGNEPAGVGVRASGGSGDSMALRRTVNCLWLQEETGVGADEEDAALGESSASLGRQARPSHLPKVER